MCNFLNFGLAQLHELFWTLEPSSFGSTESRLGRIPSLNAEFSSFGDKLVQKKWVKRDCWGFEGPQWPQLTIILLCYEDKDMMRPFQKPSQMFFLIFLLREKESLCLNFELVWIVINTSNLYRRLPDCGGDPCLFWRTLTDCFHSFDF